MYSVNVLKRKLTYFIFTDNAQDNFKALALHNCIWFQVYSIFLDACKVYYSGYRSAIAQKSIIIVDFSCGKLLGVAIKRCRAGAASPMTWALTKIVRLTNARA